MWITNATTIQTSRATKIGSTRVWFLSVSQQQERLDIEEKYTSLQEEAQGKTKKLKKVWTMLMAAKSEVSASQRQLCF